MANVFGYFTEMGSILMTDVDYVIKDGKKYKLDVEKYLNKKSLQIPKPLEEIPFDDDEPLTPNREELPKIDEAHDLQVRKFHDLTEEDWNTSPRSVKDILTKLYLNSK